MKRVATNICHAVWNIDLSERIAALKRTAINTCHAVWNVDLSERIAVLKRVATNTCHAIGDVDLSERIAVLKCSVTNTCRSTFLHTNRICRVQSWAVPKIMILTVHSCINRVDVTCFAIMILNPRFNVYK